MSKAKIVKRLSWYYPTERFFAFMFLGVFLCVFFWFPLSNISFLLYGLFVVTLILFQGQHYLKLKLYRLTNVPFEQEKNLVLFRKSKTLNIILISAMPLVFVLQLRLSDWTVKAENQIVWAFAANVFGILEHINYYHRQLSIDNLADVGYVLRNRKLKVASLQKDLIDNEI